MSPREASRIEASSMSPRQVTEGEEVELIGLRWWSVIVMAECRFIRSTIQWHSSDYTTMVTSYTQTFHA